MTEVLLIPSFIADQAKETIPLYVMDQIRNCKVIFAENERTARRFLKAMDPGFVIDDFEWHTIHKTEEEQWMPFQQAVKTGKNIAIISEAGCPGVADPGQYLVSLAQQMGCKVRPLVGPSSILLALMASGMNGQQFEFVGYLPVDQQQRAKRIKELELHSSKNQSTKIFIETPYRNEALWSSLLQHCLPDTSLCIAIDLTGENEQIHTKTVSDWRKSGFSFQKLPAIFLLYSGKR